MVIAVDPEWWKTLFDEVYLLTDARSVCDADVTRKEVNLIFELLPILPHHKVLDLCGGHGRHTLELRARGITRCVLVDYSRHLLKVARMESASHRCPLDCVVADARSTGFRSESFHHVVIMGNSLGYLCDPEADAAIFGECFRLLRPGGWLLADLTEGRSVRKRFHAKGWHEVGDDILVCREREMQLNTVSVRELVVSKTGGMIRDRTYSIRFYETEDVEKLLSTAGFVGIEIITDFSSHSDGGDHGFMDCRMIAVGRKP